MSTSSGATNNIDIRFNPVYKPLFSSTARYKVLYGGAGSGKSQHVAQQMILRMIENPAYKYLVVRKTGKAIKNSVFALASRIIAETGLAPLFHKPNKSDLSITCLNGATMISSGLDDVEKLKSIDGVNVIWIEEANEVTEQDFNQLDLRLRGVSSIKHEMFLTFNPVSDTSWLKKVFFDIGKEDALTIKTTYLDNEFLDDRYRGVLESLKDTDYQYYKIYALGEWGSIGNLVFRNWEKRDLSSMVDTFDNTFNGLDFGFAEDPTAYIRVHYNKKKKEIYVFDEFSRVEMATEEIAEELKKRAKNEYITCDSSEPRTRSELRGYGVKAIPAKKGAGSIEHGIKWLQAHKIIVDESCTELIKELGLYKWKEDKDGNVINKAVDKNNHLIDALRYALEGEMTRTRFKTIDKSSLGL